MTDDTNGVGSEAEPKKKSKGFLIALVLALLLGSGAFYGVYSGMVPLPFGGGEQEVAEELGVPEDAPEEFAERPGGGESPDVAFVALEPFIVSLGPEAEASHLKVKLSIEVATDSQPDVVAMTPRIMDVLNTFLRAVDEREFELPHAMMRLRAQMLRRVQLVTPEGAVRDVLIQEFVLN